MNLYVQTCAFAPESSNFPTFMFYFAQATASISSRACLYNSSLFAHADRRSIKAGSSSNNAASCFPCSSNHEEYVYPFLQPFCSPALPLSHIHIQIAVKNYLSLSYLSVKVVKQRPFGLQNLAMYNSFGYGIP